MMKFSSNQTRTLIVVVMAIGLSQSRAGSAQDDPQPRPTYTRTDEDSRPEGPARVQQKIKLHAAGGDLFDIRKHGRPADEIRQAAEAVVDARTAADDEVSAQAKEKLTGLLDEYFEDDMTRREQELKDIEQRLEKLRAQLARRREKKDEIIDLQMKVAMNEAEGLGFFGGPGGHPQQAFFSLPVRNIDPLSNPPGPPRQPGPVPTTHIEPAPQPEAAPR